MRKSFTEQEWELLQFAPLWTFVAVADADTRIDKLEWGALAQDIAKGIHHEDKLVSEVFQSIVDDFAGVQERFEADQMTYFEGLEAVRKLVDKKLPVLQAQAFKKALFVLGRRVAAASDEGGTGDPVENISQGEMLLLASVVSTLGLKMP